MTRTGQSWVARCNLCRGWVVAVHAGARGRRCLRCTSTYVHRALGAVLGGFDLPATSRVYELSSRGALVRYLKRRFHEVTLSEWFDGVAPGAWRRGTQCQDVERLTYADATFDLVTSTEVFEHVADDAAGFAEVARVLAPGGRFVFTVPLAGATTVERARRVADRIEHLLPPEYHGDRLRGRGRVLAYRTYGNDIIARLSRTGLAAEIVQVDDPTGGTSPTCGVIVARKDETAARRRE